jgi:malonyl-CoA O-methyltransferase
VVVADGAALPFADESFELAFCNLVLQWEDDPRPTLAELRRVLAPRGLLLLTSFGPDTLAELRDAWAAGDRAAGGSAVHVNRFLDLHDLGDALVQARFVEPVLDVEHLTTTYGSMRELMRELKGLGAHNVNAGRARGLTGRRRFAAAEAAYPRDAAGRAPATWEVVYGTAWTPLDRGEGAHSHGPLGAIPLDALRAELRKRR